MTDNNDTAVAFAPLRRPAPIKSSHMMTGAWSVVIIEDIGNHRLDVNLSTNQKHSYMSTIHNHITNYSKAATLNSVQSKVQIGSP